MPSQTDAYRRAEPRDGADGSSCPAEWFVMGSPLLIFGVLPVNRTPPMARREAITDILDARSVAILRSVTAGDCALVDPDDGLRNPREITKRTELAADDLRLLVSLLLDVDSWFFATKRCLPRGTAVIRLTSDVGDATLLIGMSCDDWEVTSGGHRTGAFFDPVADDVRGILKRAFPEIASPESRSMWRAGAIAQLKKSATPA